MEVVDPRIDPALVPSGSRPHIFDGAKPGDYIPLPSIRTPLGHVITRWRLSEEERKRIVQGEDIFVTLISSGNINPLFVTVGPVDWTCK